LWSKKQRGEKENLKKLYLDAPETEQIEINGEIFGVNISDIEIINRCADFAKKYACLQKGDIESIKSAANGIIGLIDDMLGEGAAAKIGKGRPVNIVTAYSWLMSICKAIYEEQDKYMNKYIEDKYE